MRTLIGIQARSRSTRLPNKVAQLIGGKPVLCHVVDQCEPLQSEDTHVSVLVPNDDYAIMQLCDEHNIHYDAPCCVEDDLIERYLMVAKEYSYDAVVRITSDCPLIPTSLIKEAITYLKDYDYVCNTIWRTYPDGYDIQACTVPFLQWIDRTQNEHREHPFYLFDTNLQIRGSANWKVKELFNPNCPSRLKISIDTQEDLDRVRAYYEKQNTGSKLD